MRDTIYRDEAIEAVCGVVIDEFDVSPTKGYEVSEHALSALPSAGPQTGELISREEPTVIRSRTFMPTKDFREWAERIRDVNPNAVVIPCDAEVVSAEAEEHRIYKDGYNTGKAHASADAVQGWIPFTRRPMTEEEQKEYPNCTFMFDCVLPDDGEEILVSNRRFIWMDTFCNDIDGCYLDGGDIDEDMAWMPLPKPYKGGDSE